MGLVLVFHSFEASACVILKLPTAYILCKYTVSFDFRRM